MRAIEPHCDEQVGQRIRRLRKGRKMTQSQLAPDGMTRQHLSKIERGVHVPSQATLDALAGRLGVTPYSLAWGNLPPRELADKAAWIIRTFANATSYELREVTGRNPPFHKHKLIPWLVEEYILASRPALKRMAERLEALRTARARA